MATQEIALRTRSKDIINNVVQRVLVSNADDYIPALGTAWSGDSGVTARNLASWTVKDSKVPGFYFVTESYQGYNARP